MVVHAVGDVVLLVEIAVVQTLHELLVDEVALLNHELSKDSTHGARGFDVLGVLLCVWPSVIVKVVTFHYAIALLSLLA